MLCDKVRRCLRVCRKFMRAASCHSHLLIYTFSAYFHLVHLIILGATIHTSSFIMLCCELQNAKFVSISPFAELYNWACSEHWWLDDVRILGDKHKEAIANFALSSKTCFWKLSDIMWSRGISRKSNMYCDIFSFLFFLNWSPHLGEVHFAEDPTWIGPFVPKTKL